MASNMEKLRAMQNKMNNTNRTIEEDIVDSLVTEVSASKVEEKPKKPVQKKSKAELFTKTQRRTERHSIYLPASLERDMHSLLDEINKEGDNKSFNDLCVDILQLFFAS